MLKHQISKAIYQRAPLLKEGKNALSMKGPRRKRPVNILLTSAAFQPNVQISTQIETISIQRKAG